MRVARVEPRHTFSIYLPFSLYQKLLDKAGKGKINTFIKEVLEEKLRKGEQDQKEKLRKRLIEDYQTQAKSKQLQKELRAMEAVQFEDLKDE
ncbi:protein of unknown function [endosymbiont DhMRE of Dentiscutata heterogama]|uniref:hypothetical protein n=1 Tax=endosymbiont DhMRE of Dentiscutata heterogama TaxID=1609546 RepID=UPI000629D2A9|nr:hypothetical protein [endosymbiont DhMRE of Dentiscutata heterogama]CFW93010.1 protein of unknown function [endosymbiont DhMRE of Dentiscutata heterogama]